MAPVKRGRGRPRRNPLTSSTGGYSSASSNTTNASGKRGRGRPPKKKQVPQPTEPSDDEYAEEGNDSNEQNGVSDDDDVPLFYPGLSFPLLHSSTPHLPCLIIPVSKVNMMYFLNQMGISLN